MSKLVKRLFVVGAGLTVLPPLIGFVITVLGMIAAFHDLGQQGIADPKQLAGHIGLILTATLGGLIISVVGIVVLIVAGVLYGTSRQGKQSDSQGT